jgi:hypothetical protein
MVLAANANAANATDYDSGRQEQTVYRNSGTVGYGDDSYSVPRVIHRVRVGYKNSGYTCH